LISSGVLKQLDGLKNSENKELGFKARRAAIIISKNIDNITWDTTKRTGTVDEQLIKITEEVHGILITNDIYLKIEAMSKNVPTKGYSLKSEYTGVEYLYIHTDENRYNEELDKILQTGEKPKAINLEENQYLIVKDLNSPIKDRNGELDYTLMGIFKYNNKKLHSINEKTIKNKWTGYIKPRNPEQVCLFDGLYDPQNTIVYAGGSFGVGKSFILSNFALQELEKENIRKIIYIPNNAYVENAMDLGFLPGDKIEKSMPSIGPLVDLIGIDEISRLFAEERLEVVPLAYIRGRNFENSIILVNEAQNLDFDHIKLLIGRVGEKSRIFFDGSLKQIDSDIFKNKNGLKLLLNLAKSPNYSKLFSTVRLQTVERSITAQVAEYLDNLE